MLRRERKGESSMEEWGLLIKKHNWKTENVRGVLGCCLGKGQNLSVQEDTCTRSSVCTQSSTEPTASAVPSSGAWAVQIQHSCSNDEYCSQVTELPMGYCWDENLTLSYCFVIVLLTPSVFNFLNASRIFRDLFSSLTWKVSVLAITSVQIVHLLSENSGPPA